MSTPSEYQGETDTLAELLAAVDAADEKMKTSLIDLDGSPDQAVAYLTASNAAIELEIAVTFLRMHLSRRGIDLAAASRREAATA